MFVSVLGSFWLPCVCVFVCNFYALPPVRLPLFKLVMNGLYRWVGEFPAAGGGRGGKNKVWHITILPGPLALRLHGWLDFSAHRQMAYCFWWDACVSERVCVCMCTMYVLLGTICTHTYMSRYIHVFEHVGKTWKVYGNLLYTFFKTYS